MKQPPSLPVVTDSSCGSGSAPVFNCIAILKTDPETRKIHGRSANLPNISATGNSERDVLIAITRQFKWAITKANAEQHQILWIDPPERAAEGEVERFIPVHL
jgi:hypothetical protein